MKHSDKLGGAITCARYAFAPNYFHYCGPDTHGEFGVYVAQSEADGKLVEHLTKFETLYPYLKAIATANNLQDPFDPKVVEAYWVGNLLLNKVKPQETHEALIQKQALRKKLNPMELRWLLPKLDSQAKLHHSFHVFNVFTQTGRQGTAETVSTMDLCRIGWGKIMNEKLEVRSQRLEYIDGQLQFVPSTRKVVNPIENLKLQPGDWVSFHWGYVCEKLSINQVKWLGKLTHYHLGLANQTL